MSKENDDRLKGKMADNSLFFTHPSEPIDAYTDYLHQDPLPADESSNPRNLFDDSNRIDRRWLKSARDYLRGLN